MDLEQPQSPQTPPTMDGPVGLGGWMVLPLLGLVAAPIRETTTFADVFDRDTIRDVGQSVVQGGIWTLYMNHSRRVQNTFVN